MHYYYNAYFIHICSNAIYRLLSMEMSIKYSAQLHCLSSRSLSIIVMLVVCNMLWHFYFLLFSAPYPVLQVLLLAIIDSVSMDGDKVVWIGTQKVRIKHKKWTIGEKGWLRIARVGLPTAFLLIALAILQI